MPHYEELTVKKMLAFAFEKPGVRDYFPEDKEIEKLPREWICNVLHSVIGKPFKDWVKERVDARNQEVKVKADGEMSLDPRVAKAFRSSTHVSSKFPSLLFLAPNFLTVGCFLTEVKGKAVEMMKEGKRRRRSHKQVLADKKAKEEEELERRDYWQPRAHRA